LNVETLTTTFISGANVQTGTYRVTGPIAQFYGATTLSPEKSTNYSAGIVLTPMQGLLVTLDGYSIEVKNRIGVSKAYYVTQEQIDQLAALQYVGVGGSVQYFTNGFDTKTKGLDLVATYPFHVGAGRLLTTLAYNYNKTDVPYHNPDVITDSRILDIQHLQPNDRVNLNLDYNLDKIRVSAHVNYYGTNVDDNDYPGQVFSAKTTTDLEFSYLFPHNLTATIGARNIFDVRPDTVCPFVDANNDTVNDLCGGDQLNPLTGGLGDGERYPRAGGPFGINGAFWYARLGVTF
jgi:iron complex outermembrane receptor protein